MNPNITKIGQRKRERKELRKLQNCFVEKGICGVTLSLKYCITFVYQKSKGFFFFNSDLVFYCDDSTGFCDVLTL